MTDVGASDEDTNSLLESSLSSAFSVVDAPRVTPKLTPESSGKSTSSTDVGANEFSETASSSAADEQWKKDYEVYDASWKAESAARRESAERTRTEWEAKRRAERGEGGAKGGGGLKEEDFPPLVGPPNPHFPRTGYPASPSPADVRDSVSGEPSGHSKYISQKSSFVSVAVGDENSPPASQGLEQSSHWEEVSSMQSSLSFPEPSQSASPELPSKPEHASEKPNPGEKTHKVPPARPKNEPPPSVSLSVFDSRLSKRSRVMALVSSFAINLALPFVNGVMLGFGEIFARTLLATWGWTVPGGAATAVGIRTTSGSQRKR